MDPRHSVDAHDRFGSAAIQPCSLPPAEPPSLAAASLAAIHADFGKCCRRHVNLEAIRFRTPSIRDCVTAYIGEVQCFCMADATACLETALRRRAATTIAETASVWQSKPAYIVALMSQRRLRYQVEAEMFKVRVPIPPPPIPTRIEAIASTPQDATSIGKRF